MSERVPTAAEFEQLVERVTELEALFAETQRPAEPSPFMTIKEAAAYIRAPRHRVDALLSQRAIPRTKDGARTLIRRSDLDAYLGEASEMV